MLLHLITPLRTKELNKLPVVCLSLCLLTPLLWVADASLTYAGPKKPNLKNFRAAPKPQRGPSSFMHNLATLMRQKRKEGRWSYTEGLNGPNNWGELRKEWEVCRAGKKQSPINIETDQARKSSLKPVQFSYKSSPIRVYNTGYSLSLPYQSGSYVKTHGHKYELSEIILRSPSEHRINGKAFDMEVQFVHRTRNKKWLTLSVLIEKGEPNEFFQKIWNEFPNHEKEDPKKSRAIAKSRTPKISAFDLLPKRKTYYQYEGSHPYPPCKEEVEWHVLSQPIELSEEQIDEFRNYYDHNVRPIQNTHGRRVVTLSE